MIYEYKCLGCSHDCTFEQKISDKAKKKCPECGKMKLKRLISGSTFRLVGSGWFKDGY